MTITASPVSFRGNIIHALKRAAASRCAWFFAAVWFASVLGLTVGGHDIPVASIVVGFVMLPLSLLVVGATGPAPAVGS